MVTAASVRDADLHRVCRPGLVLFHGGACRDAGRLRLHSGRGNSSFAWNHGDIQDEIARPGSGYVGQGVDQSGIDSATWSDHTDVRPTHTGIGRLEG